VDWLPDGEGGTPPPLLFLPLPAPALAAGLPPPSSLSLPSPLVLLQETNQHRDEQRGSTASQASREPSDKSGNQTARSRTNNSDVKQDEGRRNKTEQGNAPVAGVVAVVPAFAHVLEPLLALALCDVSHSHSTGTKVRCKHTAQTQPTRRQRRRCSEGSIDKLVRQRQSQINPLL
jgi:hypothetical protein